MENKYKHEIKVYNIYSNYLNNFDHYPIKINKKYMIILIKNTIVVYDFQNSLFLEDIVRLESNMTFNNFDFHTNNDNIFFICLEQKVLLYEIDNKKLNLINTIQSYFNEIFYGCFNPFKSNLFLSASSNGYIKIFDITSNSSNSLINLEDSLENVSEIKWDLKYIGFIKRNYIIYFEFKNFKSQNIKKYISQGILNFYFLSDNDDSLIIIKENKFEIIKENKKVKEFDEKINYSFFYGKQKILIIINNTNIKGHKIDENFQQIPLFDFNQDSNSYISDPLFINANYLNPNEICEIYQKVRPFKILSFSIVNKKKIEQNTKNENNKIDIKKINKIISDIPLILSKDNNENSSISSDNPNIKKYFKIDCINVELINVKKRNLLQRKKEVEKGINEFDKKKILKINIFIY